MKRESRDPQGSPEQNILQAAQQKRDQAAAKLANYTAFAEDPATPPRAAAVASQLARSAQAELALREKALSYEMQVLSASQDQKAPRRNENPDSETMEQRQIFSAPQPPGQTETAYALAFAKAVLASGFAASCIVEVFSNTGLDRLIVGIMAGFTFLLVMAIFNRTQNERFGRGFWSIGR